MTQVSRPHWTRTAGLWHTPGPLAPVQKAGSPCSRRCLRRMSVRVHAISCCAPCLSALTCASACLQCLQPGHMRGHAQPRQRGS